MADLPQMNRRLATRPIDPKRRLPIPYAQLVNPDGTANFAAIDGPKALRGAANRDCGLCGQRMGRWVAFLGGPRNVEHGGYLDPPMHVSCAEDATRLCPHLKVHGFVISERCLAANPTHDDVRDDCRCTGSADSRQWRRRSRSGQTGFTLSHVAADG